MVGHKQYMDIALDLAEKSTHNFKHAALIVKGNKILSYGHNRYTHGRNVGNINSFHAEECTINKCTFKELKGATMYIARIASYGPAFSKPCKRCQLVLKSTGVKQVFFSSDDGIYCMPII